MKKIRICTLICVILLSANLANADNGVYSGGLNEFNSAVGGSESNRTFNQTGNIQLGADVPTFNNDNSTLIINGNNCAINGTGADGTQYDGLEVGMNQTLYVNNVSSFSNFLRSSNTGSAILTNGNTYISNSVFNNNVGVSAGYGIGGAIRMANHDYRTLNIDRSSFNNNSATYGGALGTYAQSSWGMDNTSIVNVTNSSFTNNSAAQGGAIYNNGYSGAVILNITNSNFISNYNVGGTSGGAIYNLNAWANIKNSYFNQNGTGSDYGGVIFDQGSLSIDNSVFDTNTSQYGGALYEYKGGSVITNSGFVGNTSGWDGGAIYNNGGSVTITNSYFVSNKGLDVYSWGGAICNEINSNANLPGITSISNSIFTGNQAGYGGAIFNYSGIVNITNSIFYNNIATGSGGAIYNIGQLNIVANNGLTAFLGNTSADGSDAIYFESGTMNLNAGNNGLIYFGDKIYSEKIDNPININKQHSDSDATSPLVNSPTNGTVYFGNQVNNSTINMYGGTLALGRDNYLNNSNLNLYGGMLNLMNNSIGTMKPNSLSLNGNTRFGIDVDLANGTSDKISSATSVTGSGSLILSGVNLLSQSGRQNTLLQIADQNTRNYVQLSGNSIETPLYKYNLSYSPSSGTLGVANQGFTPSVLATPVGAQTGTVLTQASMYHEAFSNADAIMLLPQSERLLMKYNNKYAYAGNNFVFSPTLLPEEDAGTWVKQFTSFENVPLQNGPRVSNVSYGMLVGRDSALKELGNGYDGYISAYVGYNGSHQNYDNVGIYQNGGLLGLTGTVYKGNFFTSVTGNVGASAGNAYTSYGTDNFTMLVAGLAAKTGYNFEFLSGKFILQPSYMMSYTFADTLNYTAASGADIKMDPINAIQIVPGVKFIFNLENGWQPYLGVDMVWNIMDTAKVTANDVQLPQMSVNPYVEYGVGIQRKWGDRFTGFIQTMLRGGGRNGLAIQLGFRWAIGKDPLSYSNTNHG